MSLDIDILPQTITTMNCCKNVLSRKVDDIFKRCIADSTFKDGKQIFYFEPDHPYIKAYFKLESSIEEFDYLNWGK